MANSQNGWAAITSGSDSRLVSFAPITGKVRSGDVHTVFTYLANQFNSRVEAIRQDWSWGWAYRNVTGGASLSNHASGTAVDFNAPNHPIGKSGTFSSAQVTAIRAILATINRDAKVVRWGGDYSGRKDEMHFEIVGNSAQVAAAAKRLSGSSTSTPTTGGSANGTTGGKNADGSLTLVQDGIRGRATIGRQQEVFGTPIDLKISKPSTMIKAEQAYLNSAIPSGHIRDLTGEDKLAEDGREGPATWSVRGFYLWNMYGQAVFGRAPTMADYTRKSSKNTIKLLQYALNKSRIGSKRY